MIPVTVNLLQKWLLANVTCSCVPSNDQNTGGNDGEVHKDISSDSNNAVSDDEMHEYASDDPNTAGPAGEVHDEHAASSDPKTESHNDEMHEDQQPKWVGCNTRFSGLFWLTVISGE